MKLGNTNVSYLFFAIRLKIYDVIFLKITRVGIFVQIVFYYFVECDYNL